MSYPYYGMVLGGAYLAFVAARRIADWIARPAGKPAEPPPAAGTPL
jgi:hypothetical protein